MRARKNWPSASTNLTYLSHFISLSSVVIDSNCQDIRDVIWVRFDVFWVFYVEEVKMKVVDEMDDDKEDEVGRGVEPMLIGA